MKRYALALLAGLAVSQAIAETASAAFVVTVNLWPRSQAATLCTAESQAGATSATVRVTCTESPFVRIDPVPTNPVGPAGGGPYHFSAAQEWIHVINQQDPTYSNDDSVKVSALRISNVAGSDGPLEMLVTF